MPSSNRLRVGKTVRAAICLKIENKNFSPVMAEKNLIIIEKRIKIVAYTCFLIRSNSANFLTFIAILLDHFLKNRIFRAIC